MGMMEQLHTLGDSSRQTRSSLASARVKLAAALLTRNEHAECVLLARDAVKLEPSMAPAVQGLLQLCERAWEHPGMDTSDVRIDMAL